MLSLRDFFHLSLFEPTLHQLKPEQAVCNPDEGVLPGHDKGLPPGVKPGNGEGKLTVGLSIPLVVQGNPVGALIVHSTTKPHFPPGAVALLQTFSNQLAIAIQRAGLIDSLQEKTTQLERAQKGLAQKERI